VAKICEIFQILRVIQSHRLITLRVRSRAVIFFTFIADMSSYKFIINSGEIM